ncbi:MAG: acyltransferase family protein [Sphingomonas pseudosanguinis]|uniref:acyltransferase family protein n=1 Tax=Sphingomonas pseudosanguinis TaxID=413712 RepID=UPI00391BF983
MRQQIYSLQAARGLAALTIMAVHANTFAPVAPWLEWGRYSVQLFFFLSGYIIFHIHDGRPIDLRQFAVSRAIRIYPPYLPIGLFSAIAYVCIGRHFDWLASLTLMPGQTALIPAWTLQREVFFYAFVGFLFYKKVALRGLYAWAAIIIAVALTRYPLNSLYSVPLGIENLFFVLGATVRRTGWVPTFRCPGPLLALGDASYAIYLVHLPLMGGLWRVGFSFLPMMIISVLAGLLYHRGVERPLIALTKRLFFRKSATRRSWLRPIPPEHQALEHRSAI